MSYIPAALRRRVAERASHRCEYCLLHDEDGYLPHEVDHVYAEKHGGKTTEDNLCLSCITCNRYKGSDLASLDPETGEPVLLFHPRRDRWAEHFELDGPAIRPLTSQGRATIRLLHMNDPERLLERAALIALGRYP